MTAIHIFDASALLALFRGHEAAFRLLLDAEAGRRQLVWPAGAIAEANIYLRADPAGWEALLLSRVEVTDLTGDGAINAGLLGVPAATGHVVHEARLLRGVVVTLEPYRYGRWTLPLMVM
jgi:hypothetical protein